MPPQPPPSTGIKWNAVAWYSKLGVVILFVGAATALGFYSGIQFKLIQDESVQQHIVVVPMSQNNFVASSSSQQVNDPTPADQTVTVAIGESQALSNFAISLKLNSVDLSQNIAHVTMSFMCSTFCTQALAPHDFSFILNVPTLDVTSGYTLELNAITSSSATLEVFASGGAIATVNNAIAKAKNPPAKPIITSISPSSGLVGTKVKITGKYFSGEKTIQILSAQGLHAYVYDFATSTDGNEITFTFPNEINPPASSCLSEPCPTVSPVSPFPGQYAVSLWGSNSMAITPDSNTVTFTVVNGVPSATTSKIVTGYVWDAGTSSPIFASVMLPMWGVLEYHDQAQQKEYELDIWDGSKFVFYKNVHILEQTAFPTGGVRKFRVTGISPDLAICPDSHNLTWGVSFTAAGQFSGTRTDITTESQGIQCDPVNGGY